MRLMICSVLVIPLLGCGGSLAKPVTGTVVLQRENNSNLDLLLTRNNQDAGTSDKCTLQGPQDWCSVGVSEIRFTVSPSLTLYRAYVRNDGETESLVTADVHLDNGRNARTTFRVPPHQTVWAFEIGIETVKVKAGS
jgi:hypothetical protein